MTDDLQPHEIYGTTSHCGATFWLGGKGRWFFCCMESMVVERGDKVAQIKNNVPFRQKGHISRKTLAARRICPGAERAGKITAVRWSGDQGQIAGRDLQGCGRQPVTFLGIPERDLPGR
jgi:hypothetical protein